MGKAEPVKFTASLLYGLLQTRHTRDLLVGECPTGTAYAHGYGQLDAWAMKRSWTDPRVWGYEIKVTRSDFIRDAKWRKYLDYCTEFFFVTAPGICDPTEIPPEAGLLVAAKTGTRLFTKKHAPARAPDKDALFDVLKSLLINRAVMRESRGGDPDLDRAERMERLKSDMADRRLLAAHIHEEIRKGWLELRQQRDQAKREVERYEGLRRCSSPMVSTLMQRRGNSVIG